MVGCDRGGGVVAAPVLLGHGHDTATQVRHQVDRHVVAVGSESEPRSAAEARGTGRGVRHRDEGVDDGSPLVTGEWGEAERPRDVGDRRRPGVDRVGHATDGSVGYAQQRQVGAFSGGTPDVVGAVVHHDTPADRGERTGERPASTSVPDDPYRRHVPLFAPHHPNRRQLLATVAGRCRQKGGLQRW